MLGNENKHWSDNPEENAARRETWWTEIPYAALQQARHNAGYESDALDQYIEDMPDDLAKEARRFAKEMYATEDTGESYELAKKISKRVKALGKELGEEDEPQPKPTHTKPNPEGEGKPDQDDDQKDDDDGDGDSDGDGEGKPDDDKPDADKPKPKGFSMEDAEDRKADNMQDVFGKYGPKPNTRRVCTQFCAVHDTHLDLWKSLEQQVQIANVKARVTDIIVGQWRKADKRKDRLAQENLSARAQIGKDVSAYGARLARLLMSQESKRNEGGYSSGRIDRRRLSQLVAGNQNIFARTEDVRTSETRLMLAVDGSSSMRSINTMSAVHVVNDALGRAGVKYDVTEWGGLSLGGGRDVMGDLPWIVTHKHSHENYRKLQTTLNFQPVGGDTPSYAALMTYANMISSWHEPRKILLMLTDGEPNGNNRERDMCSTLVKEMEAIGIEVIGIGIGIDVSEMFEKYVLTDFNKLGETLLGSLEKLLISQGHAHA